MKIDLGVGVSTPQDLKATVLEVRRYARWFSQNTIKAQVAGSRPVAPLVVSETAARLIGDIAKEKPIDAKSLDELIAALQDLETSSPRITITLAALPPGSLKKTLVSWCRDNIAPNILVDFKFNATILGGMVVRYGSHVYDWSFRRQILASRDKFPGLLRHV